MQVGLNPSFFYLGLYQFFFMHIILLSLNDPRKTIEVFFGYFMTQLYSFVSLIIPSQSSGTTNYLS